MAKITDLTELTTPLDTDYMVVVDESAGATKKMELKNLLVALDGDHLDVDFSPSYYTPAATPAEAADADDLAAHLYGIDQQLVGLSVEQAASNYTVSSTKKMIIIDATTADVTATLPSAATLGAGYHYIIKLENATNDCIVATNGTETIDDADAWKLANKGEVLEIVSDGTNWKLIRWDLPRPLERPEFVYSTATSFTIGAFTMRTPTLDYPKCYVKAAITHYGSSGGGGSNANNTDLDTTGWHYLYIDASAVDTKNGPELDASCFLSSTDEPDWDSNYGIWVGDGTSNTTTSDICVFAFRVSAASTIFEFWHDGSRFVAYGTAVADNSDAGATTWEEILLTVPEIPYIHAQVNFRAHPDGATTTTTGYEAYYRPGGSSGSGVIVAHGRNQAADSGYHIRDANAIRVVTGSNYKIDIYISQGPDANNLVFVQTTGFYLPKGM